MSEQARANTDREIWRKGDAGDGMSYYEPSIHVTEQGLIGINVGGHVFAKPVEEWHRLAEVRPAAITGTWSDVESHAEVVYATADRNSSEWMLAEALLVGTAAAERHTEYDVELGLEDLERWIVLESGHLHAKSAEACADDYRRYEFRDKTVRVVKKTVTREIV